MMPLTESELRSDIAAFDAALQVDWIGRLTAGGELEAVVSDGWGQYRWPWLKTQRKPATTKAAVPAEPSTVPLPVAILPAASAASPLVASRYQQEPVAQMSLF